MLSATEFRTTVRPHVRHADSLMDELKGALRPIHLGPGNLRRVREIAAEVTAALSAVADTATQVRGVTGDREVPLVVELGKGIVEVLSLSDASVRQSYGREGITMKITHGRCLVRGKADALDSLQRHCLARASGDYEQPLWYTASAKRAADTIRTVLGG